MTSLILSAPAKINLSLRVAGKREDGFHSIDTLMVKLPGLADRLELTPAAAFSFTCSDPDLPGGEDNLVVRAARAYAAAAGVELRGQLALTKVIPHAAGLGGGSSDAATALVGLDRLYGELLDSGRLREIAASLGSDVPFFLTEGAARCTGRGEIIDAVAPPRSLPVLLLKPDFGVETAAAYARWQDSSPLPGVSYEEQTHGGLTLVNDLERPVFAKFYFLAELKQWLLGRNEVAAALMSGSGSCVFAILHDLATAPTVAAAARQELDPELWSWSGLT
jgi:4-diphosphocytidyl-2-C-methyl-D-erythritol kinase